MTNANDNTYPTITFDQEGRTNEYEEGLTKREYFAAMAMQGMLANNWKGYADNYNHCDVMAYVSVNFADALIKALNETP